MEFVPSSEDIDRRFGRLSPSGEQYIKGSAVGASRNPLFSDLLASMNAEIEGLEVARGILLKMGHRLIGMSPESGVEDLAKAREPNGFLDAMKSRMELARRLREDIWRELNRIEMAIGEI